MTRNTMEKHRRAIKLRGEPSFVGRALSLALASAGIRARLQSCRKALGKSRLQPLLLCSPHGVTSLFNDHGPRNQIVQTAFAVGECDHDVSDKQDHRGEEFAEMPAG